jgi:3-oxoadipate enol-lactonase
MTKDGTILTHRVDGDGAALLLLNGGLMSVAAWDPLMARLTERYQVIRCDFRGQLLSPGPAHDDLADHARDLVSLLDHLDVREAHVVGPSFGAEVALILAARFPAYVRSLVCITATDRMTERMVADSLQLRDAALAGAAGGNGAEVFRILAPMTFSDAWLGAQPGFIEERLRLFSMLPASFFDGLCGLMSALVRLDLSGDLPRIEAPTLVLGAALDRIFPPEHSRALAGAIRGARLEIVEAAGHGAIVEATDTVVDSVIRFLEERDRSEEPQGTQPRGAT